MLYNIRLDTFNTKTLGYKNTEKVSLDNKKGLVFPCEKEVHFRVLLKRAFHTKIK